MKISFIELEGFRGVRAHFRFNVPGGFLVITGRNGSGKSTICDAIEFALTGSLSKYADSKEGGETTDQYIWWRGSRPANRNLVRIGLHDEIRGLIEVTRTPSGLEVSGGAKLADVLCDRTVIARDPLAQLCRTAIIRDESIAALSVDLAETERFTFVRTALGTDALDEVVQRGKAIQAAAKRHAELANDAYARARETVTGLLSELSKAKAAVADLADVSAAEEAVRRILDEETLEPARLLAAARKQIASWRQRNDTLTNLARDVELIRRNIQEFDTADSIERRHALSARTDALRVEVERVGGQLAHYESLRRDNQKSAPFRARLAALYEAAKAVGLRDENCPLCGTHLSEPKFSAALESLLGELAVAEREEAARGQQMAELAAQAEAMNRELSSAELELRRADAFRQEWVQRLQSLREQAGSLIGADQGSVDSASILAFVGESQERLNTLGTAVGVLETSTALERVAELEQRVAKAQSESDELERRLRRAEGAEASAKRLLSGIRRAVGEIVEERLAALDPLLKDLYARLRPHSEWMDLNYKVRGDVRKYLSLRVGEDVNPRFTFSSGQRRAIGLAFLLSVHLSRPWCRLRSLILDDPVQHIDDFRSLHLVEVLSAIRRTGRQVICAVEDEGLAELMCRRLRRGDDGDGLLVRMGYRSGDGAQMESAMPMPSPGRFVLLTS